MSLESLEDALTDLGLRNLENIHWNLTTARLYESAIRRREGHLAHLGPLVTRTGSFTGRAPNCGSNPRSANRRRASSLSSLVPRLR